MKSLESLISFSDFTLQVLLCTSCFRFRCPVVDFDDVDVILQVFVLFFLLWNFRRYPISLVEMPPPHKWFHYNPIFNLTKKTQNISYAMQKQSAPMTVGNVKKPTILTLKKRLKKPKLLDGVYPKTIAAVIKKFPSTRRRTGPNCLTGQLHKTED